jgi:Rha family phage regulatory protein
MVIIKDDKPLTTSRKVAEIFGKSHKHVLRDIENLKQDCPADFRRLNFGLSHYSQKMPTGGTKKQPEYILTKDGFSLLAMGFTGAKAMAFKISFIETFNNMEAIVTKRLYGDGVTLTELKKKVTNQHTFNLWAEEDTRMYLLSEVLRYLGYSSLSQEAKYRYQQVFKKIDGKLWCTESFVKMKIRSRAALNERKSVLADCERIAIAEKKQAKLMKAFNKKHGGAQW